MEILSPTCDLGSGARKVGRAYAEHGLLPEVSTTLTTGVLGQQDTRPRTGEHVDSYPYVTVMGNVTVPRLRVAKATQRLLLGFSRESQEGQGGEGAQAGASSFEASTSVDRLAGRCQTRVRNRHARRGGGAICGRPHDAEDLLFDRAAYDQARAEVPGLHRVSEGGNRTRDFKETWPFRPVRTSGTIFRLL